MSLNGLDGAKVSEAYKAALTDAGGWFLLKYASRDEVDLLSSGVGGVTEIRNAIEQYTEKSPLYGFIQYRRRKVLLKYLPDGTSRMLQVRLNVHMQQITETFTPHDTTFPLTSPEDLTETALSSACALHTASGSLTSSSSSLRRRRLNEITEDAGENITSKQPEEGAKETVAAAGQKSLATNITNRDLESAPQDADPVRRTEAQEKVDSPDAQSSLQRPQVDRPLTAKAEEASKASNQTQLLDLFARSPNDRRQSSQSTRPSAQELDYASAYKPKVKLGPRPSLDMRTRPQTSGSYARQYEPRPVASLPAGVRAATRRKSAPQRPKSQGSAVSSQHQYRTSSRPPPVPTIPIQPLSSPKFYSKTPITPSLKSTLSSPCTNGITPEKQRLMKALQLRKKQMAMSVSNEERKEPMVDDIQVTPMEVASIAPLIEPESPDVTKRGSELVKEPSAAPLEEPRRLVEPHSLLQDLSKGVETTTQIFHVSLVDGDVTHTNLAIASPISLPEASEEHSSEGPSFTDESEHAPQDPKEKTSPPKDERLLDDKPAVPRSSGQSWLELKSPEAAAFPDQVHDAPALADVTVPRIDVESAPVAGPIDDEKQDPLKDDDPSQKVEVTEPVPETRRLETTFFHDTDEHSARGSNGGRDESTSPSTAGTRGAYHLSERKTKGLGLVDPIRTISSTNTSDDNLLSDDSLIEELQSATVQEAKPMSVSKSPHQPMFPRPGFDRRPSESSRTSRTPSNSFQIAVLQENSGFSPASGKARSVSARSYQDPTSLPPGSPVLTVKKVNVSSGISKRIKALEMLTSRDSSPGVAQSPPINPTPSSSPFTGFRNSISRTVSKNVGATATLSSASKAYPSPSPSPDAVVPRSTEHGRKSSTTSNKGKRDSISVTARIIRDPADAKIEAPVNASEPRPLTLHKSPLTVERDNPEPPTYSALTNKPKTEKRRLSLSSAPESRRDSTVLMPKSETEVNRMSFSGRSKTEPNLPRSTSDTSSIGISSVDEVKEDRKESRRSRLIKRMSLITSGSRRSLVGALNPGKQENLLEGDPIMESEPEPPQMVDIGDVNVQFPDSLLWKRRFMRIDDQGYLVLDPSRIDDTRSTSKRYHLSEFRTPCIPDQDREELPNSILLDFCDGSTLQCACESRRGQTEILHTLVDAHRAYHQLYSP